MDAAGSMEIAIFVGMTQNSQYGLQNALWNYFVQNAELCLLRAHVKKGIALDDAVHELRVATKKIRTIFRLVELLSAGDFRQKKQIAELRKLFKAAGPLRETHVHQEVLETYSQLHLTYYRQLSLQLKAEKQQARAFYMATRDVFAENALDKPAKKLLRILEKSSSLQLESTVSSFITDRLQSAFDVLPAGYDPESLHKSRILLKEAMYLMSALESQGLLAEYDPLVLKQAKVAAELAGDWHDREVFYQWLQHQLVIKGVPSDESKSCAMLLQELHANTRSLVRRFREAMSQLQEMLG